MTEAESAGWDFSDPTDPPGDWQREHARRYVETGGAEGHEWRGVPTLLLTTRGRRTGLARRTPLIYGVDAGRYLVVASAAGRSVAPAWYQNLVAEPRVQVQVGVECFGATARTATGAEKPALWRIMTEIWPAYDEYQAATEREIPVVVLERVPAVRPQNPA
jgi:deazaflavin-dependent oxidoreductase (nitroreductase family)